MRTTKTENFFNRPIYVPPVISSGISALFLLWLTLRVDAAERQVLQGHVPIAVSHLQPTGRLAASTRLGLAIGLPVRQPQALSEFLHQLYNPASPNYRRFLTPQQFAERFGPSEEDYQALIAFARSNGLAVEQQHPNRLLLDVTGSAADIEHALHIHLNVYHHSTENRTFYAPDTDPTLDLAVPVLGISGLNNYSLPRPRLQIRPITQLSDNVVQPNVGSGPGGTYMGNDFRAAYVPDSNLTGAGQAVGLVQFDGYSLGDIVYYEQKAGLPNVPLQNVLLDGFNGNPSGYGGEIEVCLDIEAAISMAPGVSKVIVYMAGPSGNWHDMLNRIATDNLAKQISCSWYIPNGGPDPVADQIWQQMAAQGQSFFDASGDYDAFTGPVDFPGETPYITQVGGTTLTTAGVGGSWSSEKVWNWNNGIGSGGGISTRYPIPWWQTNAITPSILGSTTMRNIPDVALTADNVYVRADNSDHNVGGTSCAAPLWAGFMALVNQRAVQAGKPTLGFLNPALYALGGQSFYTAALHDITVGNNESSSSPTKFSAVTGYDLCTGWGTPTGARLITALATPDPLIIVPGIGFAATGIAGGPFNVTSQLFSLTNSGTSSLTWSLTITSAWLSASSGGGTLAPGGPAAGVSIGLNSAASNLTVGTYSTSVWFTNLSDHAGQSVPFSLAILEPPTITQQPVDQAALEGATAQFTVTAAGSPMLIYQWQFYGSNLLDGAVISGSTSNTLTILQVSDATTGGYTVIVTNLVGSITSAPAQLTIKASAPVIVTQPTNVTIYLGHRGSLNVGALGSSPLSYQWQYDGAPVNGAARSILQLTNVQYAQAGDYSVLVTNVLGSTLSATAVVTVLAAPPCTTPPAGLVSWWRSEDNAYDEVSGNNGVLSNGVAFTAGMVDQAFQFNGTNSFVEVPDSPTLRLTNELTIEFWVRRQRLDYYDYIVEKGGDTTGGTQNYAAALHIGAYGYCLHFPFNGGWRGGGSVGDTNWHHCAVTARNGDTDPTFYIDGVQQPVTYRAGAPTINLYPSTRPLHIGAQVDPVSGFNYFSKAIIDELSIYDRVLSASEIQAIYAADLSGKCVAASPPTIASQPTNQTTVVGGTAMFSVIASGSPLLTYQWFLNATNPVGSGSSTLTLTNVQLSQAGIYSVLVTNDAGQALSSNAVLTVNLVPPLITTQPVDQTVLPGTNVAFSVVATGTPPLSFLWQFNGNPLPGRTTPALVLTNVQGSNAGLYSVIVTNLIGTALSSNALLTVLVPGTNCVQPDSHLISWWNAEGDASDQIGGNSGVLSNGVKFASGMVGQAFQFNGSNSFIEVADSPALRLTNELTIEFWVRRQRLDYYDYIVEKGGDTTGGTQNYAVALHIGSYGYCLHFPFAGGWRGAGSIADTNWHHCAVTARNGDVNPTFYIDGVQQPVTYSYGASTLNLYPSTRALHIGAQVDPVSGFNYFSKAIIDELSFYDRVLSAAQIQSIYQAGAFGKCGVSGPPDIILQPTNQMTPVGGGAVFSVTAAGSPPLGYQWFFNGTNAVGLGSRTLALTNVQLNQAGSYSVLVTNTHGATLSSNAALTVYVAPPSILAQPLSQTVLSGSSVSFGVIAGGSPTLTYQWRFNSLPLSGQTDASLMLTNVQGTNSGSYSVLVTNLAGSVLSSNALLSVLLPQTNCIPAPAGLLSWWPLEGNGSDINGTNIATISGNASFGSAEVGLGLNCTNAPAGATIPDSPTMNFGAGVDFSIEAWIRPTVATTTYDVMNLVDKRVVPNDTSSIGYEVYLNAGRLSFELSDSFSKPYVLAVSSGPDLRDGQWHHIAATLQRASNTGGKLYVDGQVVLTFDPTTQQGDLTTGQPLLFGLHPSYPQIDCNYRGGIDEVSLYGRALTSAEVLAIYNAKTAGKCAGASAPSIIVQPSSQTVAFGSTASFAVLASGTAPLSYQWLKGGDRILGANGSAYSIGNVQSNDIAVYAVVITNVVGSTLSSNASLMALQPPSIISQPRNTNVLAGNPAGFTVTVTGDAPLSFQWRKDGTDLAGATSSTYSINSAQPMNAGTYSVVVTNQVGSITSSNAILTVWQPPFISVQPQSTNAFAGTTATISVGAGGTAPLAYSWQKNGSPLPGATDATYAINNVQTNDAGTYAVLVTNAFGYTLSSNAVVNVLFRPTNCVPAPTNLISWWPLEGNGIDVAGTNFATPSGNIAFAPGEVALGLDCITAPGGVTIADNPSINFGASVDFSIEAWVKPVVANTTYNVMNVVDKRVTPTDSTSIGYEVYLNSGRLSCELSASLNSPYVLVVSPGPDLRDGSWHHVVITLHRTSTTGGTMYVDGQPVMTFDPTPAQGDLTTTQPLLFGLHPAYPRIDCNYRGGIDEVSIYRRALTAAEVQTIYAAGAAGKCNIPAGPAILTQPSSQVVALGTNVVFSVTASGTPPLSYQWFKLGLPITNAKDSSLLISNVRSNDAGTYSVLITNYQGGMLSSNASLTVVVPPRILLQPNHQLAQPGCSAIFTVAAKGTPPLSYQWWKDGAPLIGQTNASLSLNDVQTNDLGNYSITITNVYGTTTSTPAALSWDRPPIANSDTILRFQSGGVRVKASDLTANDTDPDGDVLSVIGVSLTSAAGGTVGLNGPWVYYQPPPGFTNTDSFTYTVSDGICYGWAVGIVTVLVRTDNTPAGKLLIESVGDGSYRLAVDGAPGAPYRLQSAETLSPPNWQDLASGTADTFGVFQYVHFPGTNAPAKYYRSVSP